MSGRTALIILVGMLLYPIILSTIHFILFCDFARKVEERVIMFEETPDA